MLMRDYSYHDTPVKLAEHTLSPTPAFRLGMRWYPAAHFTSGAGANIGLDLSGMLMLPVDAKGSTDTFKTSSLAFGWARAIACRSAAPSSASSPATASSA